VKYSPGDFLKVENIREHIGKYFIKNEKDSHLRHTPHATPRHAPRHARILR